MVQALGDLKAPWEVSKTQKFTPRHETPFDALASARPFSVGRARAQRQLQTALATQDELARVRRLEQALQSPSVRYERAATPRLSQVTREAHSAMRELFKKGLVAPATETPKLKPSTAEPAPPPPPTLSPEEQQQKEEEAAALRIQSRFRGGKEREAVQKMKDEETKAATKIQSIFRGQAARRELES